MKLFLPNTLSSGMVLQRNTKVNLWGSADKTVTVRFLGQCYTAQPDTAGHWLITLDNLPPGGPHVMRIGDE
ncbi:MAG: sialate O-acetylesterase, partial [Clostridia bacterium]|nr:sialate O-acetylesterase [Clostridia bacterium]